MSQHLQNGQTFPRLDIPAVGGGVLHLPEDFAGSYAVLLIYRGHWCPFCNEQMAAFVDAFDTLSQQGIKLAAFSVDDEASTQEFIAKHHIRFPMGHSADIDAVVDATGAYVTSFPTRGRFLETTGFVIAPDGSIVNAVYSSRAIGRLVPSDVIRLVAFMRSLAT
ncbi:peroxiredoxin family protein [Acidisoma cellulosilytica]|uniref:thioredoxin-dependent peroxiredoxin n=1 Tax=Acidisoma cellulosilyticum TaxID=2802395 RepID=A0A963Z6C4_9PROT|nr:redoxin domain-containing protein [Acidisoma cellulosilyticum]MCB8883316.1 peroxiredoxin family protein [Acidisoma cellulosilyticum]